MIGDGLDEEPIGEAWLPSIMDATQKYDSKLLEGLEPEGEHAHQLESWFFSQERWRKFGYMAVSVIKARKYFPKRCRISQMASLNKREHQRQDPMKSVSRIILSMVFLAWTLTPYVFCELKPPSVENMNSYLKQYPGCDFQYYDVNYTKRPSWDRLSKPPQELLQTIDKIDHREHEWYACSGEDRKYIKEAIERLPPRFSRLIHEKLIGLYFFDNLFGSGWKKWVIDDQHQVRYIIMLNSAVLKMPLGKWMSWKENSAFDRDVAEIKAESKSPELGFLGILLHEVAHIVDAESSITPVVDPSLIPWFPSLGRKVTRTEFVHGVWRDYDQVEESNWSPLQGVRAYAPDEDKTSAQMSAALLDSLRESPFVSFYAAQSWSEDFAELAMHETLRSWFGIEVKATYNFGDWVEEIGNPLDHPMVSKRLGFVHSAWEEAPIWNRKNFPLATFRQKIEGKYQRISPQNNWHTGNLIFSNDRLLIWKNLDNIHWRLHANGDAPMWWSADEGNPYANSDFVDSSELGFEFKCFMSRGKLEVLGFSFLNEFYVKLADGL